MSHDAPVKAGQPTDNAKDIKNYNGGFHTLVICHFADCYLAACGHNTPRRKLIAIRCSFHHSKKALQRLVLTVAVLSFDWKTGWR